MWVLAFVSDKLARFFICLPIARNNIISILKASKKVEGNRRQTGKEDNYE